MVGEAKEEAVGREPCRTELGPVEGLDLQARYNSGRVAGDFYDAIRVGTRVAFLLSDIAGHRVDAHPIAAAAQEVFRKSAAEFFGPADANLMDATAQLVQVTNLALIRASKGVHFAPTFLGCFDVELGVLAYINAGGQTAVISDSDGTRFLPNVSMPMGLFTHLTYEPSMQAFERGAKLLVVTKGVIESRNQQSSFGAAGVLGLLERQADDSAAGVCEAVLKAAHGFNVIPRFTFRGLLRGKAKLADDLTAMVLARRWTESSVHEFVGAGGTEPATAKAKRNAVPLTEFRPNDG